MVFTTIALVGLAALLVLAANRYYGQETQRVYSIVRSLRMVVFGAFMLLTALIFLSTGITGLMVAGFVILVYIFAALVYDIDVRAQVERVIP